MHILRDRVELNILGRIANATDSAVPVLPEVFRPRRWNSAGVLGVPAAIRELGRPWSDLYPAPGDLQNLAGLRQNIVCTCRGFIH